MVTQSGLWIKDEVNEKTLLIKSELIKENILSETIINEFNDDFELIRTIQSKKIDIAQNNWIIFNKIITKNNISQESDYPIYFQTNFDEKRINKRQCENCFYLFLMLSNIKEETSLNYYENNLY